MLTDIKISEKMRTQTVAATVLVGLLGLVNAQVPATAPQGVPAAIWEKVTKFNSDIASMRAAGKIDNAVVIADVQAIADAARASLSSAPKAVQDQLTKIQTQIQAVRDSGKVEPGTISGIVTSFVGLASSNFPGFNQFVNGAPGAGAGGLPAMNGAFPAMNGAFPAINGGLRKPRATTKAP